MSLFKFSILPNNPLQPEERIAYIFSFGSDTRWSPKDQKTRNAYMFLHIKISNRLEALQCLNGLERNNPVRERKARGTEIAFLVS